MTTVYRVYSCTGTLLYVGCATNFSKRLCVHHRNSEWWLDAARIEMTHFETSRDALIEEENAIRKEKPRFNILNNPDRPAKLKQMTNGQLRAKIQSGNDFTVKTVSERKRALMVAKVLNIEIITRENEAGGFRIFIPSDVPN